MDNPLTKLSNREQKTITQDQRRAMQIESLADRVAWRLDSAESSGRCVATVFLSEVSGVPDFDGRPGDDVIEAVLSSLPPHITYAVSSNGDRAVLYITYKEQ